MLLAVTTVGELLPGIVAFSFFAVDSGILLLIGSVHLVVKSNKIKKMK